MNKDDIYRQMAERTEGNIYLGIVGPVRTGKSTFIKRFMDLMVMPAMKNGYLKERFQDEMPQAASGKTVMTTQIQFVPDEAVEIILPPTTKASIRLVDCVGYMVDGALGLMEEGVARMVKTPWFDEDVTFEVAAETGTRKVIEEYSTIGIVVTTDGSITNIERQGYVNAERRVIDELKVLRKPFIVIVNSTNPTSPLCQKTLSEIKEKYDVTARAIDVLNMKEEDIAQILGDALYEFPARIMKFAPPKWLKSLPTDHWLWVSVFELMRNAADYFNRIRDYEKVAETIGKSENIDSIYIDSVNPGEGEVCASLTMPRELFYKVLGEGCNMDIKDDAHLMSMIIELAQAKNQFDYFKDALDEANATGYGIVNPSLAEMELDEPQIIKKGKGYGVSLSASAPSWHIMKAKVSAQISPMVGSEQQGEELVKFLLEGFENNPAGIWDTEIFGKSLNLLMREGLNQKLKNLSMDARIKFKDTIERVINDNSGGVVCILY